MTAGVGREPAGGLLAPAFLTAAMPCRANTSADRGGPKPSSGSAAITFSLFSGLACIWIAAVRTSPRPFFARPAFPAINRRAALGLDGRGHA
jgi:hypothetical protein